MRRYILTDAGNVLTRFNLRSKLIAEIMAGFGVLELDLKRIFRTDLSINKEDCYHYLDTGELSLRDLWEQLITENGISENICSYPLFISLWCRHLAPIEEVIKLYRKLQENFSLVVVSNGDAEGVRHIIYHLIGKYGLRFEEIFISSERGRKKPELFNDVLEFLHSRKVNPADCVFVDDLDQYVMAASNLGIPAICFDASKQDVSDLETALAKLGFVAP